MTALLIGCPAEEEPTGDATTADADTSGPECEWEVPAEVDEFCQACKEAVAMCFIDPCGFESDPNDCFNWTVSHVPECECVGDSSTGGDSSGSGDSSDSGDSGSSTTGG